MTPSSLLPPTWLALLCALAPLVVGAAASRLSHASATGARRLTYASAGLAVFFALLTGVAVATSSAGHHSAQLLVLDPGGVAAALSVYVDPLTCVMLLMVGVVGVAVSRFSIRYLDGDPGQARFSQWLGFTLGAVLTLIIAGNLVMLWLGWVASSLGLHKLLTFYRERSGARRAAKKKFLISRLGDVFLLFAFLLVYLLFGSVEYEVIFARAPELAASQPWATLAGVFLVLGAITKSAQLPFHSWLPDTMETPTPVSAFMHAGIINAGGFLLIRLSPLLVQAPVALTTLAVVGASTAVFASVVMLTQTDIKRKLAFSTVAQMGFMMLQIGLGAFSLAVLHIVGHSFYKAHAFSSASSVVRASEAPAPSPRPGVPAALLALIAAAAVVAGLAVGLEPGHAGPGATAVLYGVLALAVAQMTLAGGQVTGRAFRGYLMGLVAATAVAVAYFGLSEGAHYLLRDVVADGAQLVGTPALALVCGLFAGAFGLQLALPRLAASSFGRQLYVHANNGFYLGVLQDRFVDRLWPDAKGGQR